MHSIIVVTIFDTVLYSSIIIISIIYVMAADDVDGTEGVDKAVGGAVMLVDDVKLEPQLSRWCLFAVSLPGSHFESTISWL